MNSVSSGKSQLAGSYKRGNETNSGEFI